MAVTKIIPIRATIQNSVEYICDPNKTDDRLLVHSEHCFPHTAGLEFSHYLSQTRAGGNTIGRHLIQSFAPGEVSPKQAHEIGKQLAAEILKGEYGFVLATHVDRGHVHNHFVWCAANIVTHKRYRSNKNTYHEIRDISDRLCKENELSIIVAQGRTYGKSYENYFPEKSSASWRDRLQATIDNLIPQSADFEDLLKQMEAQGYKVKRGKHISFSAPGQERFTRAKSLGEGYTEETIRQRILEKPEPAIEEKSVVKSDMPSWYVPPPAMPLPIPETPIITPPPGENRKPVESLIDIAGNPKYAERRGLEQWAKLRNLKNSAAAFALMQEYGGFGAFSKLYHACCTEVETIENGIAANEKRIDSLGYWRKDIDAYNRTRKVYNEYKALRKSTKLFAKRTADKFYEKHEDEIITHENAALELRDVERPLPKLKDIDAQIEKIKAANVKNNEGLAKKQAELKRLNSIHTHLWNLNREHQPKPPQIEQQRQPQQRKRSYDLER